MLRGINNNIITFKSGKQGQIPALEREKTVAILGASKETPQNKQYIQMAYEVANDLAKQGFNVVTGGGYGIMKAANEGAWDANPKKSFAVNVKAWVDEHKKKIFNLLTEVDTGAQRTDLFRNIAKYWIVFPGGPGTMQELSVGGESKYYKSEPSPEMILVGKKFQQPLFDYLKNMNDMAVATNADKTYQLADSRNEIVQKVVGSKINLVA
ncbi:MAG: LOG family protein [Cyanobacteriota bacterium]